MKIKGQLSYEKGTTFLITDWIAGLLKAFDFQSSLNCTLLEFQDDEIRLISNPYLSKGRQTRPSVDFPSNATMILVETRTIVHTIFNSYSVQCIGLLVRLSWYTSSKRRRNVVDVQSE